MKSGGGKEKSDTNRRGIIIQQKEKAVFPRDGNLFSDSSLAEKFNGTEFGPIHTVFPQLHKSYMPTGPG
jgi:hypothetical protein